MRIALGIDLGATKVACGLVREDGAIEGRLAVEPTGNVSAQDTARNVFRCIDRALAENGRLMPDIAGIGMGSAGPISALGTYGDVDTMPHMWGFELGRAILERYGVQPAVDNDANCFALAEATFGAGRGEPVVVGLTLGTGFGCGIIVDGRVLAGATANAGEVARCWINGSVWDDALSGGGVAKAYEEVSGKRRRGEEVFALAGQNDGAALEAWKLYGRRLGSALGIIAAILDPGAIVLGGSVAAAFRFFQEEADAGMRSQASTPTAARVRLCASALGPAAGCLGAAALALKSSKSEEQ